MHVVSVSIMKAVRIAIVVDAPDCASLLAAGGLICVPGSLTRRAEGGLMRLPVYQIGWAPVGTMEY